MKLTHFVQTSQELIQDKNKLNTLFPKNKYINTSLGFLKMNPNTDIKVILTDMDGTVMGQAGKISPEMRELFNFL